MIFPPTGGSPPSPSGAAGEPHRAAVQHAMRADEATCVRALAGQAALSADQRREVAKLARELVIGVRERQARHGGLDAFLSEFQLSSQEGVVLLCLAEALLRIPDPATADRLIRDKLAGADWAGHLGKSESIYVNASTIALMLTGRIVTLDAATEHEPWRLLAQLVARSGEPMIRRALTRGMRILGGQFIMGRTIGEALVRGKEPDARRYRYSFDMLGEGARTNADAERYMAAYAEAISAIGAEHEDLGPVEGPGISVKLSALHPRFELAQSERMESELVPRVQELTRLARDQNIGFTIDAEEAARLEPTLDLFAAIAVDPALKGWDGLGLAVQAYQKRAIHVLRWLRELGRGHGHRLMVRLVKGAYWDTEIKRAQVEGLDGYPVFTRKASTDVSYMACIREALAEPAAIYPQFATHNAHTLATVLTLAGRERAFEFQRLHGMGEALYEKVAGDEGLGIPCRVYAPVGGHEDLLAYLARRLLENGANTSFVNRIVDASAPVEELIADPVETVGALDTVPHPAIPSPRDLYGPERANAMGIDLSDPLALRVLAGNMTGALEAGAWQAAPIVAGEEHAGPAREVRDPADLRRTVGAVHEATAAHAATAVAAAVAAAPDWDRVPAAGRADALENAAALLERRQPAFMAMAVREGGKTIPDALAEVREAVDFLRFYAMRAREDFGAPVRLPGPTGERNEITLYGRGVFVCISPWNFPLAIFLGQVSAALAAGNAVVAKPAEQTPLIAAAAVRLMHEAGIPPEALHLLPGDGSIGAALVADARIAGVAFTGSTETAWAINQRLAAKRGPIVPFIGETGGQNAMVVDSSALPEQVVDDVIASAFRSTGQRCSALRVLFVQREVAPRLLDMLTGAMAELSIGDPALIRTDVGPVIDEAARTPLVAHAERLGGAGRLLYRAGLGPETEHGTFFPPHAFEIDDIAVLEREVFGPILHVIVYDESALDRVIDAINRTGYGLTVGVHSRIDETARRIAHGVKAGNAYVNRNMIGAVVGVQPFGGEGLSGTGPKAGGPRYLHRFATERVVSVDTTAAGGNAALMTLEERPTPIEGARATDT
ncbi:MAG: bifunctional proline dehydrogenase/L-glutamate gamma-semialdehyde dehydrogenase PutA [Alphaproteobacteria bacterium]